MSDYQRHLPPLATLVPFEAAFRHQNFTRAADELHYSQATISRRIAALEADLGVRLFDRERYSMRPTAAAVDLAAAVRLAFGGLIAAAETTRRQASDATTLTIYTDISLAAMVIAPIIGDFQRRHPDLEIRVLSSFEPIETTREDFDVGLQYDRGAETTLIVEPIADERIFPVCSPNLAAQLPPTVTVKDLDEVPFLHVDYNEPAWIDWSQFLASEGTGVPTEVDGLTFTSYQVCLDVAEQGEGVALGWEHTVRPRLDAGRLVRLPGLTMQRPDAIAAYRPAGHDRRDLVDDFLATLSDRLNPGESGLGDL